MASSWKLLLALCFLTSLLISQVSAGGDLDTAAAGWLMPAVRSGCRGTVTECLENEDEEFELDSESNRRILATRRYISYGALQRNNVPCSRRGASLQLPPRCTGESLYSRLQRHLSLQELNKPSIYPV